MFRVVIGVLATLAILGWLGSPLPHVAGVDLGVIARTVGQVHAASCRAR